jgi:hypothetical protein
VLPVVVWVSTHKDIRAPVEEVQLQRTELSAAV